MRFERTIEGDDGKPEFFYGPRNKRGYVTGNAVEARGAGLTSEEGVGILLSLPPEYAAMMVADPSLAQYLFRRRRNGSGQINTPIVDHANARIVTGFDDAGRPITSRRLKSAEFVEHARRRRLRMNAFPTMLMKILN